MNVFPTRPMIATQWNGHGDHPQVGRMNSHNWEWFPNEDDTDCGILTGGTLGFGTLVNKGDWIVECPTLRTSRIFKPEEFARLFLEDEPHPPRRDCECVTCRQSFNG